MKNEALFQIALLALLALWKYHALARRHGSLNPFRWPRRFWFGSESDQEASLPADQFPKDPFPEDRFRSDRPFP